jgi:hypothetical protein
MLLKKTIETVFIQLNGLLAEISDADYIQSSDVLFRSTIGQHVRHIIELFQCLENGYEKGIVNYEKRQRDYCIETDRSLASRLLFEIVGNINARNRDIILEAEDYGEGNERIQIPSNYYRELAYNLEHTIHHMALIRAGLRELSSIRLPEEFGVAYSTLKYRQQCAQ